MTITEFTYRRACQVLAEYRHPFRGNPQHEPDAATRRDAQDAQEFLDEHMARTYPSVTHTAKADGTFVWHRLCHRPASAQLTLTVALWIGLAAVVGIAVHPAQQLSAWLLLTGCTAIGVALLARTAEHFDAWSLYRRSRRHRV